MARDQETISFNASDGWVELTNTDATKFCFQVKLGAAEIRVSNGAATYGPTDQGLLFGVNTGQPATQSIFDVIPVTGANRVYGRAKSNIGCTILVTHD